MRPRWRPQEALRAQGAAGAPARRNVNRAASSSSPPESDVTYPLGVNGSVVGQGDSYEDALEEDSPVLEAFVAEATLAG
jgi:hypothetical protein